MESRVFGSPQPTLLLRGRESQNIDTVKHYLDGFRRNDHAQILSCLSGIEWTVFGAFRLKGKDAYDKAIDGAPAFIDPPELCDSSSRMPRSWQSSEE
jgi:hypothetical protein